MAITKVEAVIDAAGSLSADVSVNGCLVGIVIPDAWTAASITFQAAYAPTDAFEDVYDNALATAAERMIDGGNIPTTGGRYLALSLNDWLGIQRVKIRSGTSGVPVAQADRRVVTLLIAS